MAIKNQSEKSGPDPKPLKRISPYGNTVSKP